MYCRNCGAPLPPDARFCRKCGTDVPAAPVVVPKRSFPKKAIAAVKKWFDRPIFHNKRALLSICGGAALLVLILILILSIASCRPKKLRSADEVADAVIAALETGDGKALAKLASLSEPLTGQHPEIFGEGDTPHEVMQNYYRTLADERYAQWKAAYGKGFTLVPQLETAVYSGTDVFEINRALDIDAERYAVLSGTLSVGDAFAANISMTVVEWQGEWRLLVLYLD